MNLIETPCRVSADLRIHQREQERTEAPTGRELCDAKEDLAWRLLSGTQVNKVTLADILDGALNAQGSSEVGALADRLSKLMSAVGGSRVEAICDLEQWTRSVIDSYLEGQPDLIRDWAMGMR